jgi:hypothetical protein
MFFAYSPEGLHKYRQRHSEYPCAALNHILRSSAVKVLVFLW